ncbi:hypothetical protein ACLOJK_017286 [Asimina triloba]
MATTDHHSRKDDVERKRKREGGMYESWRWRRECCDFGFMEMDLQRNGSFPDQLLRLRAHPLTPPRSRPPPLRPYGRLRFFPRSWAWRGGADTPTLSLLR